MKAEIAAVKRRFPTFGLMKVRDFLRRFSGLKVAEDFAVRFVDDKELDGEAYPGC